MFFQQQKMNSSQNLPQIQAHSQQHQLRKSSMGDGPSANGLSVGTIFFNNQQLRGTSDEHKDFHPGL